MLPDGWWSLHRNLLTRSTDHLLCSASLQISVPDFTRDVAEILFIVYAGSLEKTSISSFSVAFIDFATVFGHHDDMILLNSCDIMLCFITFVFV